MRKTTFIFLFLFLLMAFSGIAQIPKNAKSVNSPELIGAGKDLYDQGKFADAEKKLKEVPIGDSLYATAQYELALTYYATEKYELARDILLSIITTNDEMLDMANTFNLLGNTLSSLSQYDEAIETYDKALKSYPYNYLLVFNKGIVCQKNEDYLAAAACFEESVFLYPAHQTSHFQLGISYLNMGLTVQGILAINYAIMLNPSSRVAITAIQYLQNVYSSDIDELYNSEKIELPEKYKLEKNRLSKLENIVKANIYRQKEFKPISKIKHPIIYQNQIIFENITPKAKAKDIVNTLYIPYFQSIWTSKKEFETYSILIFSGTNWDNNKVSQLAEKRATQLNDFHYRSIAFLKECLLDGLGKENTEGYTYMYDDILLISYFGKMLRSQGMEPILNGEITFLTKMGDIESKKEFKEEVNFGLNKFYYRNGAIFQEVPIENNKIHGRGFIYHPNPERVNKSVVEMELNYSRDILEGDFKRYYPSGVMSEHCVYVKNKMNGLAKTFYSQGALERIGTMQDDEFLGWVYDFYPNGDTAAKFFYPVKGGVADYKLFYLNGTLYAEGKMKYNIPIGTNTYYDPAGKIAYLANYNLNGDKDGAFYDYFSNGGIAKSYKYENGKLSGGLYAYNENGSERYEERYSNGQIIEYRYFITDSIQAEGLGHGRFREIPSIYGFKEYTVKQVSPNTNEYTYYFAHGGIYRKFSEVNERKEGVMTTYYHNGHLYNQTEYRDGELHGLSISYHANDTIEEEGYYLKGKPYGAWYTYHPNGKLSSVKIFSKEGNLTNFDSYNYDGSIDIKRKYYNGMIQEISFFNEKGEVFKTDKFVNGNGTRRIYYYNGNPHFEVEMKSGKDIGKSKEFDFQGNVRLTNGDYVEGEYNGLYNEYDNFGILRSSGEFILGSLYGYKRHYYINGSLQMEQQMLDNEPYGELKQYHSNGKLALAEQYENGVKKGVSNFYAADGSLACQIRYSELQAVEYAYRGKNGKMTDFKPIEEKLTFSCYYANGKKSMDVSYEFGLLHGEQRSYYPDGTLHLEKNMYYNLPHGEYKEYYPNGRERVILEYLYGDYNGECKTFYENGKLHTEEYYKGGYLHNEIKRYDPEGKLIKQQNYFYGNLLEEINY